MTPVAITYWAQPLEGRGFIPLIAIDGRREGTTWSSRVWDRDDAEAMARAMAEERAARFLGDYRVTVTAGGDR